MCTVTTLSGGCVVYFGIDFSVSKIASDNKSVLNLDSPTSPEFELKVNLF